MIGAPNSLNLNCKVRVMKEAPDSSVSEEIADIFRNYNIDKIVVAMENFEKCIVAMIGGPCSQHVTVNTSWLNQP